MFLIIYTRQSITLMLVRIQKNNRKVTSNMHYVYDDVTYFSIRGFKKDGKIQISSERDIFTSNEKIS